LKSAILCLLLFAVVSEGSVRIKVTAVRGNGPSRLRQKLASPRVINETLVGVEGDVYYKGIVHVGTPPKEFVVDFDTGSDPLWIAGVDCKYPGGEGCTSQVNRYDLNKSSTGKDLHHNFSINYGKGSVKGELVSDIVGLTPNETAGDTKSSFKFGFATDVSDEFANTKFDGLFGLSFSDPNTTDQSYIEYLRDNNVFDPPIFTIWLERNASNHVLGGDILFGEKDKSQCGDDLVTVKVTQKPWWTFNFEKVLLNGQEISGPNSTISDSGTSAIAVPYDVFETISKKYPLNQAIDCSKYRDIELTIQIEGKLFKLTADDLIISYYGQCQIFIVPFSQWIFGDPFLKEYCQIHNYKDETLTLAVSKHQNLHQ